LGITGTLDAEYEWRAHARLAARHGVTEEDLIALRSGSYARLEGRERAAVAFAIAVESREVDDAAWDAARVFYSDVELLDLVLLAGFYGLAARVALALDIEPDPDTDPSPTS
jgi:alkylhydroperoxidase family enzyme